MSLNEEALLRALAANNAALAQTIMEAVSRMIPQTATAGEKRVTRNMHKYYSRLEKFGGDESKWKEWFYQFSVATNAYDVRAAQLLEEVEKMEFTEVTRFLYVVFLGFV